MQGQLVSHVTWVSCLSLQADGVRQIALDWPFSVTHYHL